MQWRVLEQCCERGVAKPTAGIATAALRKWATNYTFGRGTETENNMQAPPPKSSQTIVKLLAHTVD